MKNFNNPFEMDNNWQKNQMRSKILAGILIIMAGVLIFLNQIGMQIPHWLLSWEMILMAAGFVTLVKHSFRKTAGYIMILIAAVFMLNDFYPGIIEVRFVWPLLIIVVGLSMLFKSGLFNFKKQKETKQPPFSEIPKEDFLNATSIFSGVTNKVLSKQFKGGNLTSIFGGNEVNLSQADFIGEAEIDLTCIFGGITLIVPSGWKVKTELTSVFGGVDDQRPILPDNSPEPQKTLIIRGTCVFGGVELHSYN